MDYRRIISQSWHYTQNNKKLIFWFGFLSSLLTTTIGVWYIVYQFFAFKNSYIFGSEGDHGFFFDVITFIWDFIKTHVSWTVPLVIFAVIFAIAYFLYPILAKAAAIQTIARNKNGQEAGPGTGFRYGIMSFLPMFEYHMIIKTFSFFAILVEMSFVVRNLGPGIFKIFLPIFLLVMIVGLGLTLLFTYADFFIVIDGKGVFESMKASARMVVTHWKHTVLITILMILIGVRIIIQVIMVFLIPFLIILITGYLATITLPVTGVIVGGIVGLVTLLISAYLNGIVDIFSYTVWTHTFLEISAEKELSARDTVEPEQEEITENSPPSHKNL